MGYWSRLRARTTAVARSAGVKVSKEIAFIENAAYKEQRRLKNEALQEINVFNQSKKKSQLTNALFDLARREGVEFANLQKAINAEAGNLTPLIGAIVDLRRQIVNGVSAPGFDPRQVLQQKLREKLAANEAQRVVIAGASELTQAEVLRRQLNEQRQILRSLYGIVDLQIKELGQIEKEVAADEFTDKQIGQMLREVDREINLRTQALQGRAAAGGPTIPPGLSPKHAAMLRARLGLPP